MEPEGMHGVKHRPTGVVVEMDLKRPPVAEQLATQEAESSAPFLGRIADRVPSCVGNPVAISGFESGQFRQLEFLRYEDFRVAGPIQIRRTGSAPGGTKAGRAGHGMRLGAD